LCVTTKEKIERPAVLSSQNSARGPMKFGGISGINDTKLGEGRERERERERYVQVPYVVNKNASTSTCCARDTFVAHLLRRKRYTLRAR